MEAYLPNCVQIDIPNFSYCICKGNSTLIAEKINVPVLKSSDARSNNIIGKPRITRSETFFSRLTVILNELSSRGKGVLYQINAVIAPLSLLPVPVSIET